MCFVCMGAPAQGKFIIQPEFRTSYGMRIDTQVFPSPLEISLSPQMGSTIFAFKITATFPTPGVYTIVLGAGGFEFFRDTFQMHQATREDLV